MTRYLVREAVLIKTDAGSMWKVTFGAIDGNGDGVEIMVSPARLEQMSFVDPYSEVDIEEVRDRGRA